MMKKVLLYGIGKRCQRILKTFPKIVDYVEGFVDSYVEVGEMFDKPVYKPEIFKERVFKNKTVVITAFDYYFEIYECLREEYGLEDKQILHTREWLVSLLVNSTITIRPLSVRFESSTLCQLNCTGCYMRKDDFGTAGKGYLSYDNFKRFVKRNDFIKRIEISNSGEPFLNPDLKEILKYADKKGIEITVSGGTNFNDVSEEVLEAVVKYKVRDIMIAIDGVSQETYEIYRRNGNLDKVISNIEKLNKYKEAYCSEVPVLTWQFILMKHNECDIEMAKEMADKLNMNIQYKLDWGGNFMPQNPEKVFEVTGIAFFNRTDYNENNSEIYTNDLCADMIFNPQINWDGRLLGCCSVYKNDWKVNVFDVGLENALQDEKYRHAIIGLLGGPGKIEKDMPCGECNVFYSVVSQKKFIEI